MFINQITQGEGLPVLERTLQFAARRHELIAHNIANLSTPNFRPVDVSVAGFQRALGDAVDRRRSNGPSSALDLRPTREIRTDAAGNLVLRPRAAGQSVLYHDRNDRDMERSMQALAENAGAYRMAAEFIRTRYAILNAAIAQRV